MQKQKLQSTQRKKPAGGANMDTNFDDKGAGGGKNVYMQIGGGTGTGSVMIQ